MTRGYCYWESNKGAALRKNCKRGLVIHGVVKIEGPGSGPTNKSK